MSHQQWASKHDEADIRSSIPPKPKRPLTVFNIFSILERNYIVQQNQKRAAIPPRDTNTDPYEATRPEKYRNVILPSNWFVVGMNRVRRSKHQKHGVISFNDLTQEMSMRWKSVDPETKQYCEMIAADELTRYRQDIAAYEALYGNDAVESQKQTHRNKFANKGIADIDDSLVSHGISEYRSTKSSQLHETETGLKVSAAMMAISEIHVTYLSSLSTKSQDIPRQAATQKHWYFWNSLDAQLEKSNPGESNQPTLSEAQIKKINPGEDHHATNSDKCRGRSPTLSDYLPDDQEAALALVGNNYDNILHGEELEKAFDSD
ncbi:hypothetical protein HJC23_013530 [Cyclotella cryptica]|uniref:HMG box domain-containing protein n=1 Tax=Cyclotella cryptica TaxID=29204 RepID=A0ABD3P885_9STRA